MGLCLLFFCSVHKIQIIVCQTSGLHVTVFCTILCIVSLYRCRYIRIIYAGLRAFSRRTVRIIRKYVQIRQKFGIDLFYDFLCQYTIRLIFYIRLIHNRVNNRFRIFYRRKSYKRNKIFSVATRIFLCGSCLSAHAVTVWRIRFGSLLSTTAPVLSVMFFITCG